MAGNREPLLTVDGVTLRFGGLTAVNDVSLVLREGALDALIGPNGAGKTSLMNVISGVYRAAEGTVGIAGSRPTTLTGLRPHQVVKAGVGRTLQNLSLFDSLTVLDCVLLGRDSHFRAGMFRAGLYLPSVRREEAEHRAKADEVLELLQLTAHRDRRLGDLPYGVRKRVDLARVVATEPQVLLLDEPMAGIGGSEKDEIAEIILMAREHTGAAVLLIEHDMRIVMRLAEHITVMDFGAVIGRGSPEEIQEMPAVRDAYLGAPATTGPARGAGQEDPS